MKHLPCRGAAWPPDVVGDLEIVALNLVEEGEDLSGRQFKILSSNSTNSIVRGHVFLFNWRISSTVSSRERPGAKPRSEIGPIATRLSFWTGWPSLWNIRRI